MIAYAPKTFKKAGRATVIDGKPQPAETYEANQLTEESISVETPDAYLKDMLDAVGNDWAVLREVSIDGVNTYLRRLAGGSDEPTKAAKLIVKLGLAGGKSVQEVAEAIRSGALKF